MADEPHPLGERVGKAERIANTIVAFGSAAVMIYGTYLTIAGVLTRVAAWISPLQLPGAGVPLVYLVFVLSEVAPILGLKLFAKFNRKAAMDYLVPLLVGLIFANILSYNWGGNDAWFRYNLESFATTLDTAGVQAAALAYARKPEFGHPIGPIHWIVISYLHLLAAIVYSVVLAIVGLDFDSTSKPHGKNNDLDSSWFLR